MKCHKVFGSFSEEKFYNRMLGSSALLICLVQSQTERKRYDLSIITGTAGG